MINRAGLPKCKYCGSAKNVVRFGKYKGVQRWWCKKCQHKFADANTLPRMKTPTSYIASTLNMYYDGMSLNSIRGHLDHQYSYRPSESTLYNWLKRFSKSAIEEYKKHQVTVGDVWIADETVLKISGEKVWLWDLIDAKTYFLLASHMSTARTTRDARTLLARAAKKAGKPPKAVITDKLAAYIDGIELNFGADTKHIQDKGDTANKSTDIIKRFRSLLADRKKVIRRLKRLDTAELLIDGWLLHYNFFVPNAALGGKTPSQKAGIIFPSRLRLSRPSE